MKTFIKAGETEVTYTFRGVNVFTFDVTKIRGLKIGTEANNCAFINEDLLLMKNFLETCYAFNETMLPKDKLYNITVN